MKKLKERRYNLVADRIKLFLLDSTIEIGSAINTEKIKRNLAGEFDEDEINGSLKHLMGKGYLDPYQPTDAHTLTNLKLSSKGIDEWIFPEGYNNQKRIFLSHASEDKKIAATIKIHLEKFGFEVFLAHEDIPGTAEWRDKIISELSTCGIFLALRTKLYTDKAYTEQECGFALAMEKRILPIFIETKSESSGFCGDFQGKKFKKGAMKEIIKYCLAQLNRGSL